MYLNDNEIIAVLADYIEDDRCNQGILLNGPWGAGKSYFVKEMLIPELIENDSLLSTPWEIVYVSLHGISSKEDILEEIYRKLLGRMTKKSPISKKRKKNSGDCKELGLKLIPYTSGKTTGKFLEYFKINLSSASSESMLSYARLVIIFDDLERYAGKIQELLGFLTVLTELYGVKAVFVGNEEQMGNFSPDETLPEKYNVALNPHLQGTKENHMTTTSLSPQQVKTKSLQLFGDDFAYDKIKEKLISATIFYEPRLALLYDILVEQFTCEKGEAEKKKKDKNNKSEQNTNDEPVEMMESHEEQDDEVALKEKTNKAVADLLKGRKQVILEIFRKLNHVNLRTFIFLIQSYKKVYEVVSQTEFPLDSEEKISENAVRKAEYQALLRYMAEVSVRLKTGQSLCNWDELSILHGQIYFSESQIPSDSCQGYHFVDVFLSTQYLDVQEAMQTFSERLLIVFENNKIQLKHLSFAQLEHWYFLEETEIVKLLDKLMVELENNEYSISSFRQLIHMVLTLEHYHICEEQTLLLKDAVTTSLREKLEADDGNSDESSLTSYYLFDNTEMLTAYRDLVNPIINDVKQSSRTYLKEINELIHRGSPNWGSEFERICIERSGEFSAYRGFLSVLDLSPLKATLERSQQEDIFHFKYGIQSVYSAHNLNEKFESDSLYVKKMLREVNSLLGVATTATRKYAFQCLKETLEVAILNID